MTRKLFASTSFVLLSVVQFAAAGHGQVSFKPAQSYPVGTAPVSVAVGDLNGDGIPDLAAANGGSNNVSVLLGKGDGSFEPAVNFDAGVSPSNVVIADINGDGRPDIAVLVNQNLTASTPGAVSMLLGNGDGSFQAPIVMTLDADVAAVVAVADLNGDKKGDLVATANGDVEVFLGNGNGTFQAAKVVAPNSGFLATADFNNDGKTDLALVVVGDSGGVQIMLGSGDGTFSSGGTPAVLSAAATAAWTADLNNDNHPDLIVYSSAVTVLTCGIFHSGKTTYKLSALVENGDSTLRGEQIFATGVTGGSLWCGGVVNNPMWYTTAGDFNGDGKIDVQAYDTEDGGMVIFPGNGDGTFGSPITATASGMAADLNGDQLADLIEFDATNNIVGVFLNATPAFSMIASSKTLTAGAGQQVTDTLTFTGLNGFSTDLQLTCRVEGPQPAPSCGLSPSSIAAGSGPSTLTISVPSASASVVPIELPLPPPALALAIGITLLGLRSVTTFSRIAGKRWWGAILGVSMLLICASCSGGSTPRQPVQQYSVVVKAASSALTKTMQISLTTQ